MTGESGEVNIINDPKRFDKKPVLIRMMVIIAGPLMNFLLAVLIYMFIFATLGTPVDYTTKIGSIIENSPAQSAGIKAGDYVSEVDGVTVKNWTQLVGIVHNKPGQEIKLTLQRQGSTLSVQVVPKLDKEQNVGIIGITPLDPIYQKMGWWESIKGAVSRVYLITYETLKGLGQMIIGKISTESISGPVGIIQLIDQTAKFGLIYLINLMAFISINLGLINMIPIPALDGSRLMFLIVEAFRGRPVNPSKENFVHFIGFALLMALMVIITYRDILRLLGLRG